MNFFLKKEILSIFILSIFFAPSFSNASKVDELKNQIENKNQSIGDLEKEIAEYQQAIDKVVEEKTTLSNEVYRLNLNQKKLTSDITLTNNKIYATTLNLEKLSLDIGDKEKKIYNNNIALSESIRLMNEADSKSIIEIILSSEKISDFFGDIDALQKFQTRVRENTTELLNLKVNLEENKKDFVIKEKVVLKPKKDL